MGKWVNNGKVSIPSSHSFGSDGDILEELGPLLGVGKRTDGQFYLADMCQASSIDKWSKIKPIPLRDSAGNDVTDNAYTISRVYRNDYTSQPSSRTALLGNGRIVYDNTRGEVYEVAGLDIPIIHLNADDTLANQAQTIINAIKNLSTNGMNWEKTPWTRQSTRKRIRDFNGYNHAVESPFIYGVDKDIPMDATALGASAAFFDKTDCVSIIDIFKTMFNDEFYFAAIFVRNESSTSSGYREVVVSENKMSTGGGMVTIPSTMLQRLAKIKCYFFAYNPTKMHAVPLPSTSAYPNPVETSVSEFAVADPLTKLSWLPITSTSFADTFGYNNSTGASRMINMRQASPVVITGGFKYAPSTTGSFIFSVTLRNPTSSAITFRSDYLRVFVSDSSSTTKHTPTVYNSSMSYISGQNVTINAGASVKLYLQLSNIWSGLSVTASNTTATFLGISLSYYVGAYENFGYPTQYPNISSVAIAVARPSSSTYNNMVAVAASSSGLAIGSFTSY